MREHAFRQVVQMVCITLIVAASAFIWVAEESYGANDIANSNDRLVRNLNYVQNLIILVVLRTNICKFRIGSQSFTEPLKIKVNSLHVD